MRNFEDKLNAIKKKYIEIEKDLSQQDGIDPVKLVKLNKEYSELTTIVETINIFQPGHLSGRISWQKKKSDPRIDVFAFEIGSLFLDPFLVSRLKKFRSINANKLANFIVKSTINEDLGINQYQYSDF